MADIFRYRVVYHEQQSERRHEFGKDFETAMAFAYRYHGSVFVDTYTLTNTELLHSFPDKAESADG